MSVPTDAEAVEALAARMDAWWAYSLNDAHRDALHKSAATLRALAAERDALRHQMQIATTEQWHAGFEAGRADRDRLAADVARLRGALEPLKECPYTIDRATVPKGKQPSEAPDQVVMMLHIMGRHYAAIRAALAGETP